MKNAMKMLGVCALYVVVTLSGCKSDDPEIETCEGGTFAVTVNSNAYVATSFNNTLLKGAGAKRMDIRATDANGRQLLISFTDQSNGTTGNGVSTDAYIPFADVATGTENTFFFTIIDDGVSYSFIDGNLDITSCDADAKKISGAFSFSDDDFVVTNGSFTDLCYTVLK